MRGAMAQQRLRHPQHQQQQQRRCVAAWRGGVPAAAAARRSAAPASRRAGGCRRGSAALRCVALLDYVASASDDGPLSLPARTELDASEVKSVFGYPR